MSISPSTKTTTLESTASRSDWFKLGGKVISADNDGLDLEYEDGKVERVGIYHNFPFNRKTHRTDTALVKPGDKFKQGDMLAHSNFTTPTGRLALGRNARVGVVPMKGWSMDDAIAISDSFAANTNVNRTLRMEHEFDDTTKTGLGHFTGIFPEAYKKAQLENMDEDGVVKVGSIIQPGDPVILATAPKTASSSELKAGRLSRTMSSMRKNSSQTWDYKDPARVLDVIKTRKGIQVITNFSSPMRVGDKGAFRTGAKFIVSKITPDDQMPQTKDGKPLDMLLNQLSIYSRINSSLIYELLYGKIAKAAGKPIVLPGFTKPGVSQLDEIQARLKEAGLPDKEKIYDPTEDRDLDNPVLVGNAFVMRLHHTADDKQSSLENLALLSSGGYATMREMFTLRGQRSDQFWRDYRSGYKTANPGKPFVWNKFTALLKGAGLKARDHGNGQLRLGPLTDESVDALDPVELRNGEMVHNETIEPVKGGLFDPTTVATNRWGKITLHQPIPNPAMESSIRTLLKMTRKDFAAVMAGKMELPPMKQ